MLEQAFAGRLGKSADLLFALAVAAIIGLLFLPVPALVIDFGLALSMAASIVILSVAIWIVKPTDLSAFPTVLLLVTMLRLTLNIASARLILSHGAQGELAAGHVIAGFSRVVMGGDFVIGIIVFTIVMTINFVVITKGATRIAEVGARFTLDSIPGKQMAIDADLAAGLINEQQAQQRRRELEEETSFFGAMDGASKFVRGDAIAGMIILGVNSIGGVLLGVLRHNLSLVQAVEVFARLSIGDGLVTQIPALIVSLAAGMVVAKGGTRGSTDEAVLGQLRIYPRALNVAAGLIAAMGLLPGMPVIPFFALGALAAWAARAAHADAPVAAAVSALPASEAGAGATPTGPQRAPTIELALGRQLSGRFLGPRSDLPRRIGRLRKTLSQGCGFVIPEILVREDYDYPLAQYRIFIHGALVGKAEIDLGQVLVITGAGARPQMEGADVREPAFGAAAMAFGEGLSEELRRQGFEPISPESVLITHLGEALRDNLGVLFSYRDLRQLIEGLEPEYRRLFDEICPAFLTATGVLNVCKSLLGERVSIRNLPLVFEGIAEVAGIVKKIEPVVEAVRLRIAPQICGDNSPDGIQRIMKLGSWDEKFANCIRRDPKGEIVEFALDPQSIEAFGKQASAAIELAVAQGSPFVIVAAQDARPFVRLLTARINPGIPVLSHFEIARCREISVVGSIG
jgi:flagellar biosynthesis protein FlhA